jgi:predicted PurR-regulated permease PerM
MWPPRIWLRAGLFAAVLAAALYITVAAWPVVVPFILGAIVGWIVLPAVNWIDRSLPPPLHRHGVARLIAILSVYAVVIGLVAAFFAFFVPRVVAEGVALLSQGPGLFQSIQQSLAGLIQWYQENVPAPIRDYIARQVPSTPQGWLELVQTSLVRAVTARLNIQWAIVLAYISVPFWLIYLLYDTGRLRRAWWSIFPETWLPDVANLGRIVNEVAGDYLRGQLLVAASVGLLIGGAYYLVGVDFPIVLGILAAVGDLIPTFGPIIAAVPAVVVAIFERPILALWVVLITIGVHEFENVFIGPRVVGASVRIRPAAIIILLLVAGYLWGLLGLLLVVPIAAVLRDVFRYVFLRTHRVAPSEALRRVHRSWRGEGLWGERSQRWSQS